MAMVACVALGIAVDDTTHFMLRIQDLQSGSNVAITGTSALRIAFHQCSRAMFHTTVIAGLGLSPFLFGSLLSMTQFAALLIAQIVIALRCDLILLPSLLKTTRIATDDPAK